MPIFKIIGDKKIKELKSESFKLEIDLQRFIDKNLKEIFGLEFIKTEFGGQGLYIDTIAYDPETKSPVLIEYKKDTYQSVVDQGMAYLHWLLTHKGDYQVALTEKLGKREIDWSQPKVIFIAKRFNPHQIYASGFKNASFELYRYDLCGDIFLIEPVEVPKSDVSITSVLKTKEVKTVTQQVKTYTMADHLGKANDQTRALFEKLQKLIFSLDERIQEKPVSWYIGYRIRWANFCSIAIYKEKLKIYVRKKELEDPKSLFKKVSAKWGWGKTPLWYTEISSDKNIDYIFGAIRQAYKETPDL